MVTAAEPSAPDELLAHFETALQRHRGAVSEQRRLRHALAVVAALLGPLAVMLLSVQILFFRDGGAAATVLISAELVLLAVAIGMGLRKVQAAHETWLQERLRAALLQREESLFCARVGPYLCERDLAGVIAARLGRIESPEAELVELIPLLGPERQPWAEAVEEHDDHLSAAAIRGCIRRYLVRRVRPRLRYYEDRGEYHARLDRRYERFGSAALFLAFLMAAAHLALLLTHAHVSEGVHHAVEVGALVLPPASAAFVGLRSLFETHHLRRFHEQHRAELAPLAEALERLEREEPDVPPERFQLRLKRLVLRAEALLSEELLDSHLLLEPQTPKAGA